MREKIHSILTSILTALAVLTGSIAVPLLLRPFYHWHVDALHLAAQTGLPRPLILEAYDDVMDYCLGLRRDFAAGVLPFSPSGADHFADVRWLFVLNMALLVLCVLLLLGLWLWRKKAGFTCYRFRGRGPGFWGACGLGTAFLLVGLLAATNFNRAFTVFHHIFFPGKDNWLFNPATDPIILLPEVFFRNCALLILVTALVLCLLLLFTGRKNR